MKKKEDALGVGALDLTERAIDLLRCKATAALADYYIGTLPFVLALLFFWSDMSRNPYAHYYCSPAAAGLALIFIWMKVWQVRFCRRLWCALNKTADEIWRPQRYWRVTARQALLHAIGVPVLIIAAVIMVPMAWIYAFYQNVLILEAPAAKNLKQLYTQSVDQARLWPGQNHLLLTMFSGLALFVFLNAVVGLILLPYLFKWLLGIETIFTLSGLHAVANTTFLATAAALTYLAMDPLIKTVYTLRCFYGQSRHTGEDLSAALKPFLKKAPKALPYLVLTVLSAYPALATANDAAQRSGALAYTRKLDQQIDEVLQQKRFAWRLDRKQAELTTKAQNDWLTKSLKWLGAKLETTVKAVDGWLEALDEWMQRHFSNHKNRPVGKKDYRSLTRGIFYVIGAGLAVVLIILTWRWWKNQPKNLEKPGQKDLLAAVDITAENIFAADLPHDKWLVLAGKLQQDNDLRSALRALFLAILAQLGEQGRLTVARHKSNGDYLTELARKAHMDRELLDLFALCTASFERAWYGMHPVNQSQLTQFISRQERIFLLA